MRDDTPIICVDREWWQCQKSADFGVGFFDGLECGVEGAESSGQGEARSNIVEF